MEGPNFGGNPKPHHQLSKESAVIRQQGVLALPKTSGGELIAKNVEYRSPMDKEEIKEDRQGNEAHGFRMGKTVPPEKKGNSSHFVWA
jgi:hypothetical protein